MPLAIFQEQTALKVVVNNHPTVRQLPVHQFPASRRFAPTVLKANEYIAITVFHMLGLREDECKRANERAFWNKYNQRQPSVMQVEPGEQASAESCIARLTNLFDNYSEIYAGITVQDFIGDHPSELSGVTESQVIALSKLYKTKEFVIAYNTSANEPVETFIRLQVHDEKLKELQVLHGYDHCGRIQVYHTTMHGEKISYIKLYLKPMHLAILKNF